RGGGRALRNRALLHLLHHRQRLLLGGLTLGGGREGSLPVLFLLRLQRPLDIPVETDDLAALRVTAKQGHEPFAVQVAVTALLVGGGVLRRRAVRPDDGEIERRLLIDRDIRADGARRAGDGRPESCKHERGACAVVSHLLTPLLVLAPPGTTV